MVTLCIEMYLLLGCGQEKISALLALLNDKLNLGLTEIPCANSIGNWIKKGGLDTYERTPETMDKKHAIIIDESMMLGNEKMVLTLAVEAEKTNDHALSSQDVKVLDISVSDNWNSTKIKKVLTGIEEKTGGKPVYVVSDNDTKLKKSIREMGYRHIPDVGHTLALAVENTYKNEDDFKAFTAALGAVKIKEVMRPASYLLPPRQRSVARFMNLSASIKWGIRVLENFSKLTGEEQIVFDFVRTYQALIYELNDVFTLINAILKRIKNNGLSIKEKKKCIKMFPKVQGKSVRVQKVLGLIMDYLNDTCAKIKAKKSVWHASSDIIESIFGTYKALKSKNPLHGITNYVLLLPLLTQVNEKNNLINFDSKQALEQVLLKDIKAWKNAHLTENLAVKRQLKLAG